MRGVLFKLDFNGSFPLAFLFADNFLPKVVVPSNFVTFRLDEAE